MFKNGRFVNSYQTYQDLMKQPCQCIFLRRSVKINLWNAEKFAAIISINMQNGRDFCILYENKMNFTLKMNFVMY
jgi:hypothetical protein